MAEKLLEVKNLRTEFKRDKTWVTAVNNVSFSIQPGEILGLVGESGCGKSVTSLSIMKLLARNSKISNGEILLNGKDLLKEDKKGMRKIRGREVAMIFQEPMTSLNPVFTVSRQISEPLMIHQGMNKKQAAAKAVELLSDVKIPNPEVVAKQYPHQLSGGMRQRVMIAMALACRPKLLIADEPTTALDVTIQAQILHMIEELKRERNTSMILITHDLGIVVEMCSKVAIMYAGEIVESGTVEDIYGARQHPYTIGLFDSVPNLEDEQERLTPINGLMPDPVNLPKGCKFHPRCPYATERCKKEQPANVEVSSGHFVQCHMAKVAEKEE